MSLDDFDEKLIRVMYDAQVKKMLAYMAIAISAFGIQLTLFLTLANKAVTLPLVPASLLAFGSWVAECCFGIGIATKFQEIVMLEHRLGIVRIHCVICPLRPLFGKLWDIFFRRFLGTGNRKHRRLNLMIDIVTAIVLIVLTFIFLSVICRLFGILLWGILY